MGFECGADDRRAGSVFLNYTEKKKRMLKSNEYHCVPIIEFGVLMITVAHVVKQNKLNQHAQWSKCITHTVDFLFFLLCLHRDHNITAQHIVVFN